MEDSSNLALWIKFYNIFNA